MKRTGIVGLGLIGGSLAMALKEKGYTVLGVENNAEALSYALKNGIIDRAITLNQLVECDIVFVCVPLSLVRPICEQVYSIVGENAIITDVASVKGILNGIKGRIVGGHPMAGTENSGITASKAHLFENAYYAIVPYENSRPDDVELIKNIVKEIKANPIVMPAKEHDEKVSKISHLPHMIAYALVSSALGEDGFVGTGFMDTTRIASSDADFWTKTAFLNKENLLSDIDGFEKELAKIKKTIEENEVEELKEILKKAQDKRKNLSLKRVYLSEYTLDIDVRDEVGSIQRISKLLADNGINMSGIQIINSREGVGGALRISVAHEKDYEKAIKLFGLKDER